MIEFKELRVTPDGKTLIIDAAVKDLSYYKDVYIKAIYVDNEDTYVDNGYPSSSPVIKTSTDGRKRFRVEAPLNAGPYVGSLFFVYVITQGAPTADTPCGMDNQITMGVTTNLYPFYRAMVNYMKEVEDECEIPKNFIDALLRFKALELSIRTGHYAQAIKYWNKFFRGVKGKTINTGCRCHGWT